jgi:hypothetical protein
MNSFNTRYSSDQNPLNTKINSKDFYSNNILNYLFPDYNLYKRVVNVETGNITLLSLLNSKEGSIITQFVIKNRSIDSSNEEIKNHAKNKGSFYKCRQLGLVTCYDSEIFNSFNMG